MLSPARTCSVLIAATLWAGFLIGVSFLATPIKFNAPSLSLPAALDVGRQTFHALNRVELVGGFVLLALILRARSPKTLLAFATSAYAIVLVQTFWLLPTLDARVELFLTGAPPESSPLHAIYIALELIKLAALVTIAFITGRELTRSARANSLEAKSRQASTQLRSAGGNLDVL